MAYDAKLAVRIQVWVDQRGGIEAKAMFGGLCFLVGGNMLGGVKDANLLLRLGPDGDRHRGEPHILPFPTWARPMSGFLQVEPPACATEEALASWLERAHTFAASLPAKRAGQPTVPLGAKKPAAKKPAAKKPAAKKPAAQKPAAKKPAAKKPAKKPATKKQKK